ncbi:MAG: DEAD/DEAH box helicase family protein [Desulfosporosinus sp.]|nr:DEAD/DEAH box helicase family protein [Desulfosporosinus sp.]
MARKVKTTSKPKPELKFHQKLILNRYLLKQFGAENFKDISANMKKPTLEEIDTEGVTGFYKHLIRMFGDRMSIEAVRLSQYDLNIVNHTKKINENRDEKIVLKYFQYLSLIVVEYYLDEYFNNREMLLLQLNEFVDSFNEEYPRDKIDSYKSSDLNKIALWNATGSGKTLLMHINYHQYLHYSKGLRCDDDSSFILLTPKEGLSFQHQEDFALSNIKASSYDKKSSRMFAHQNEINILENTKLDNKDGDKKVSVKRFGDKNVVFVDEGHRGASGDTWYLYRNQLCENGFSFEYSATFGQAVIASGRNDLMQEYAKCIIFDYSYKFFYGDGYGKEYNIINLQDDSDEHLRSLYLTACLITYFQQKKLYLENNRSFDKFNLENPLFVFVGASVNAVRTEGGRKVSDVVDILLFFKDFVTKDSKYIAYIERILAGQTGLIDNANRDIFRNTFGFLSSLDMTADGMYFDILNTVFNCSVKGATMHVENLKGVQGEIRIRLGENEPFGVINVGDDSALLSLCSDNRLHTDSVDFSESLFQGITKADSTINLLIGSKKFTEGWNCWRVSTMGLMNVGRSEGSEIIQLFGRGVRLKGYGMSLKRSNFFIKYRPEVTVPKHIGILETLNVFGVRADYMKRFKEYLEAEGVPTDKEQPVILHLPVIRNKAYKKSGLYSLKVKGNLDFKKHASKPFLADSDKISGIVVDCYAKVQFETSKKKSNEEITKHVDTFDEVNLAFLDYENIYFEIQRYKNEKSRYNVNIRKVDIIALLRNNEWYKLLIPKDELVLRSFDDYKRWEKIAITLLKQYFEKYYYAAKSKWEKPLLTYVLIDDTDKNFLENDAYTISISNASENDEAIDFIKKLEVEVIQAKKDKTILDFLKAKNDLEATAFASSLYSPMLYLAKNNVAITISPVALNESENKFIQDLRDYSKKNKDYFNDKELYIIRNKSKDGIGFFDEKGFYPDFIMWLIWGGKQYITFIDPHGARNMSITDDKVSLHTKIKEIEASLGDVNVKLNSIIITPTKHSELVEKHIPKADWINQNVIFMEDEKYIDEIMEKVI